MIRKLIGHVLKKGRTKKPKKGAELIALSEHGIYPDAFSRSALSVVSKLQEQGFEAYIVGGAVRDALLGIEPKDFDIATNATPEQVKRIFKRAFIIGRRFKIVHVMVGMETFEVTTFRGGHEGVKNATGRIVNDNTYGTQAEDAARRDFSINAMYYNPATAEISDYHLGMSDIATRRLRVIGDAAKRYEEDPIRMLRAIRLAVKLDLEIDAEARAPIAAQAFRLKNEPPARLFDEMLKFLHSGHSFDCLNRLRSEGVAEGIFPLFDAVMTGDTAYLPFVRLVLDNTDVRIKRDQPISVPFMLAALLWQQVDLAWKKRVATGEKNSTALLLAMTDVADAQDKELSIPRKFITTMREIWGLQCRFEQLAGGRAFRLLAQPRFRAAYDFYVLRSEVGQADKALAKWWEVFQFAPPAIRDEMVLNVKEETQPKKSRRQARKRKKTPAADE
jgi:poly(A) polymerase